MVKKILKVIGGIFILILLVSGYFVYQIINQFGKLGNATIISQTVTDTIPFTYATTGHMLINVHVEGSEKAYPFILDSGAPNFIFSHHADEFDLENNGRALGKGSTGNFYLSSIKKIDSIQIGQFKFQNLHAKEMDFNFNCTEDIYGLIGIGVMRQLTWQIDFKNKNILITKDPSTLAYSENKIVIPLSENTNSHHLKASIQLHGHSKSKGVLVDLGSNGTLGMNESYLSNDSIEIKHKVIEGKARQGLGGTDRSNDKEKIYLFDSLIFKKGNIGFNNIPVMTSPNGLDLLGLGFMDKFRTTINWTNKTLTLEPYDSVQNFLWKTHGGLTKYDQEKNRVIIKAVIDGSPVSKAGITPNSNLISIDEFKFTDEESYCNYRKSTLKNDTTTLKVENEGITKTYKLVKEKIFIK